MKQSLNLPISTHLSQVFGWMFYAITVTCCSVILMYYFPGVIDYFEENTIYIIPLILIQILFVLLLTLITDRLEARQAVLLLTLYSMITGFTISIDLFAFPITALVGLLMIISGVYGLLSLSVYVLKHAMNGLRLYSFMLLCGFFITVIVMLYLRLKMPETIINFFMISLISAITVYEVGRIKKATFMGLPGSKHPAIDALKMYSMYIAVFINILDIVEQERS